MKKQNFLKEELLTRTRYGKLNITKKNGDALKTLILHEDRTLCELSRHGLDPEMLVI